MKNTYATIEVRVKLDSIPGWGHDPEDYVKHIKKYLQATIPHYEPVVKLIKTEIN